MSLLRGAIAAGYAALVAVNAASGMGKLGPTNGELSQAYPSMVTPAGFTFAIWGPIFLLQGCGSLSLAAGGLSQQLLETVAPGWLLTWLAECAWQFVFNQVPLGPSTRREKLLILLPASGLLVAAQASMIAAGLRLRATVTPDGLARSVLVDFPTGLNAGWLAAASGIGLSLVLQNVPIMSAAVSPQGSAVLLGAVVGAGAAATVSLAGQHTLGLGLGYATATCWACYGMTYSPTAPGEVKAVARCGMLLSALTAAALLFRRAK